MAQVNLLKKKKKSDGLNFDVDINQVKEGQPNSI